MSTPLATLEALSARSTKEPLGTIAMVVRDHVNAATMMSFLQTDWSFCGNEWAMDRVIMQGSILPLQRNECVNRMRGHFLLFIDDDMTWEPNAIGDLVDTFYELDSKFAEPIIVGGLCFRRQAPHQPTMYMRSAPTGGAYRFLEKWTDGLVEVDATGCAFLLIPVSAFEAIAEADMPPYDIRKGTNPPNLFRWDGRLGEDLRFCQDFKDKGGRIFIDTRIEISHIGEQRIGFDQYLAQIAERSADDEGRIRAGNDQLELPTLTRAEARERLGWT